MDASRGERKNWHRLYRLCFAQSTGNDRQGLPTCPERLQYSRIGEQNAGGHFQPQIVFRSKPKQDLLPKIAKNGANHKHIEGDWRMYVV